MIATESGEPIRVLIVDDNRDFAENLAELIQDESTAIHQVGSVQAAIAACEDEDYEVILLDERLPDGRGVEFLGLVRERAPDTVVVIVTAYASMQTTVDALNHGAFAFLGKDRDPEQFVETITRARRHAQLLREVRRMHDMQKALLEALPDILLVMDSDLTVHSLNRSDPRVSAIPAENAAGRPLSEVLRDDLVPAIDWREWSEEVLAGGDERRARSVVSSDGEVDSSFDVRLLEVSTQPQRRLLLRWVDITPRIQLEHRLQAAESMAALGRLSSSVAHEIRNPIAGIRVLVQLLDKALPDDDPQRENTTEVLRLTDRLSATITDLLQFAKPEALQREPFDVGQVLEEVAIEGKRWPQYDGHVVEVQRDAPEDLVFVGNQGRIRSAIAALVENALDATPKGGAVRLSARRDEGRLTLAVEDAGSGIDEEDWSAVFEPFFTRKIQGTGLGLSIVRRVADAHGGDVSVDRSAELGGARIQLRFPSPTP